MKKLLLSIFTIIFSIAISSNLFSQIKKMQYQLRYNAADTSYAMYLVVKEGNGILSKDRVQLNSQISIVVPNGTDLSLKNFFTPLANNVNYGGTRAMKWKVSSVVLSPKIQPANDFIGIVPELSNGAYWFNDLKQNDSVKMFTFKVFPMPTCLGDVRLFVNGVDPNSSAPGMGGGNFSNAFTIGNLFNQTYDSNAKPKNMPAPFALNMPSDTFEIGATINLAEYAQGSWKSSNNGIATMLNDTLTKGIGHGFTTFSVLNTSENKCATSNPQYFDGPVTFNAGADLSSCAGEEVIVKGTNPTTGSWAALPINPSFSKIENLVNGVAKITLSEIEGNYGFKYGSLTDGFDTMFIKVNARPNISLDQYYACTNDVVHGSSLEQGIWSSNNPSIATITSNGTITGIIGGNVTFKFKETATGCFNTTSTFYVRQRPITSVSYSSIKIGAITSLTPKSGGTWSNSNETVLKSLGNANFEGKSVGNTSLIFTEDNNELCPSDIVNINVNDGKINIGGPATICIGSAFSFQPKPKDGIWSSSNPTIISVDNNGNIKAESPGKATINVVSPTGDGSVLMTVVALPSISNPPLGSCVGNDLSLTSNILGTWTSTNPNVATIDATGNILTKSNGLAKFTFTDIYGCVATTTSLEVEPKSILELANNEICISTSTTWKLKSGNDGGIVSSLNEEIASAAGNRILGIKSGLAKMIYTDTKGCNSDTVLLSVLANPTASFASIDSVKVGQSINVEPNTNGTWNSDNKNIATVSNDGTVNGINKGIAAIVFTNKNGCESQKLFVKVYPDTIVKGFIYLDKNGNDKFDTGETLLPRFGIKSADGNICYANGEGKFLFPVERGSQQITVFSTYGNWTTKEVKKIVDASKDINEVSIGFKPAAAQVEAQAMLHSAFLKCNSTINFNSSIMNTGNTNLNGEMILNIDEKSALFFTSPLFTKIADNTYSWKVVDLAPGKTFAPMILLAIPPMASNSDSLKFTMTMYDNDKKVIASKDYADKIKCTFESTDKLNWPDRAGNSNLTYNNETLDYIIRYQNNTNDTLTSLVIEDVLDSNLDEANLLVKESSHAVKTTLAGNKMRFTFSGLNLPPSKVDARGSIAFVTFSIKSNQNLSLGTVVKNTATSIANGIEKTSNTVLNTINYKSCSTEILSLSQQANTVVAPSNGKKYEWYNCSDNKLVTTTSSNKTILDKSGDYYAVIYFDDCADKTKCLNFLFTSTSDLINNIAVYPNPFSNEISVNTSVAINKIKVLNIFGQVMIETNEKSINTKAIPTGIYIIEIETPQGKVQKKIVKE